jgi:glycosyltransferase involved in cell wall biosynthesis
MVSIGITTHNRSEALRKALRSASSQTWPNKEIFVIDDASVDATREVKREYPSVTWERNEKSRGCRENRNTMMRQSAFDYFVSLDDDAWFLKGDEIEVAVQLMESDLTIGAVAFDILSKSNPYEHERETPRPVPVFIGCGHVIRLSAARELNYYAKLPCDYGGEEKEFCLRLLSAGYKTIKMPGVHVWHDEEWNARDHSATHRSGVCNELTIAIMRYPLPHLLYAFPGKLANFALFWLDRPRFFKGGMLGVLDALRLIPQSLLKRSAVSTAAFRKYRRLKD